MITVRTTHDDRLHVLSDGTTFEMHDDGDLTVGNREGQVIAGFTRGYWTSVVITDTKGADQ